MDCSRIGLTSHCHSLTCALPYISMAIPDTLPEMVANAPFDPPPEGGLEPIAPVIHPSLFLRKMIHVDMDAFYASVEIRDNPSLAGKPIAVGGPPGTRSVISTSNYEARKYGVRSAMASSYAVRLCPHLIFVPPRFPAYTEVSRQIRAIFLRYTDLMEPMSLDEAYLDVTQPKSGLYAVQIARKIKEDIFRETGLTATAGVAPNKMLAKIASDYRKPDGLTVILPKDAFAFMQPLKVGKIPFVGPKTEERLNALGIVHCRDVLTHTPEFLEAELGSMGPWLWERCQGIDDRPIEMGGERKSFGTETTFLKDLIEPDVIENELKDLATGLCRDLQKEGIKGKTLTVKVKYHDFTNVTRSRTITEMTNQMDTMWPIFHELLAKTDAGVKPLRLLGVSIKSLES